jgi:hypothetical protein
MVRDNTRIMALVCRHDIPLFLVNIDTPGEQQKYVVTLIEHLFTLLPSNATVAVLYDVACVLDRSLPLVGVILLCEGRLAHNLSVRHSLKQHHQEAWLGNQCNAFLWAPMGLSASL